MPFGAYPPQPTTGAVASFASKFRKNWLAAGAGGRLVQSWPLFENAWQAHFVPLALNRMAARGSYSS